MGTVPSRHRNWRSRRGIVLGQRTGPGEVVYEMSSTLARKVRCEAEEGGGRERREAVDVSLPLAVVRSARSRRGSHLTTSKRPFVGPAHPAGHRESACVHGPFPT